MQQVKLFKGVDNDLVELERTVNRWIRKTGVRVISISGNLTSAPTGGGPLSSFAAGEVLVIVHYDVEIPEASA